MSLVKRGALLKNERLKLYKKPSTWILMGVIVALTLLNLLLSRLFVSSYSYQNQTWQEQYNSQIENMAMQLKDNPEDKSAQGTIDSLRYLLEKDITPLDWRTDVVMEYYSLKAGVINTDSTGKPTVPGGTSVDAASAEVQKRLSTLNTILDGNDWKAYVRLKIDDLKSGYTPSTTQQEKQVDIEIYNLYLDQNIIPAPQNSFVYDHGVNSGEEDTAWKNTQVQTIRENKLIQLRGENNEGRLLTHTQLRDCQDKIDVALKRLSTNTPPVSANSFLGLLESSASSLSLLSILLIVYAGGIFATEFGSGTIKLLMITPHRRQKIFWAKTRLMLEMTLIAFVAIFVLAFVISGLFSDFFRGVGAMQVVSMFGIVLRLPYLLYIVLRCLLMMLPVLAYGALALMLSVVTRKSVVAIAVTLLMMFGSEMVMGILSLLSSRMVIPGIKFLLFANTTLENYLPSASFGMSIGGSATVDGTMTLGFSLVILLVYLTCFLWIARDSFCRRDVK